MIVIVGASSGVMQFTLDEFSKMGDVIGSYFNNKINHPSSNLTTIRLDLFDEAAEDRSPQLLKKALSLSLS